MFECSICGLLSLNAISCPACGSQNLRDLSLEVGDENLPTEIPGLDDAADSWHDLEGESQTELKTESPSPQNNLESSLPFGFSGQSNVNVSRLPFGVGSHADGMPFETEIDNIHSEESENEITHYPEVIESPAVKEFSPEHLPAENLEQIAVVHEEESKSIQEPEVSEDIPEIIIKKPDTALRIVPIIDDVDNNDSVAENLVDELPSTIDSNEPNISIPDEWRIDAEEINMEEIYASKDEIVEFVHGFEEDVVVFQHEQSKPKDIISNHKNDASLSLELHPARAMDVDISKHPECREDLDSGFFAIAENSWSQAAISFQKIAARMPDSPSVFNNYGLALLQRAIEMAQDNDEAVQLMASSQFESAILALREAAKKSPDDNLILLNLAHALLVSGRSEKALSIVQVHNSRNPNSAEGANLEAASLVSVGQSVNAKTKLVEFVGDPIVEENLARLL